VIHDGPARQQLDLGQFGVKLAHLILTPDRRAELVMGDGRDHQEPGLERVESGFQPVGTLHVAFCLQSPGRDVRPGGSLWPARVTPAGQSHKYYSAAVIQAGHHGQRPSCFPASR
jgi:hypothetical protein